MFDIKAKIDEVVKKLKEDPKLLQRFRDEPIKALESVLGVDLPDDQLEPMIAGVKAKLESGELAEKLGGLGAGLGGLLGKK